MENKDLSIELQSKESPEPTFRDYNESWKKFEPESEQIRQSFSALGSINISKAVPLLISLAPALTTLFGVYFQSMTINYCYSVPGDYWNSTDTTHLPSLYEKVNLTKCIVCNGDSISFYNSIDGANNLTKGVSGLLIYLYGFYLIYGMFQDASVAIKLFAYKVRVKCNNYNTQVFIFFGFILCFGVSGTAGLVNPYPKSLNPCTGFTENRLYASDNNFPASQIYYLSQFSKLMVLMAGFFALFMALMRDAPSVFVKVQDLISLATTFNSKKTLFLEFKDIKYEVNSRFIHQAIAELGLQKEEDEKHKFLAVLAYLNENKKIFECKPAAAASLQTVALNLFGLTEDVHHGLKLDTFAGRKDLSEQEVLALCDLYNRLNDDLSTKVWPNIFVLFLGYDFAGVGVYFLKWVFELCLDIEDFDASWLGLLLISLLPKCVGAIAYKFRMISLFVLMFILFVGNTIYLIVVVALTIIEVVEGTSIAPILINIVMVLASLLFTIAWWKLGATFREIQKLKRILADQGIEVEVLRRRKLNEDEREKYLHRNPDNSTENAML